MRTYTNQINADFTCQHCGYRVSAHQAVSGVINRNHCPRCLYSRHLDLFSAGDRLCACKALMAPVGLTFKRTRDKYADRVDGELMLVHRCTGCGKLSINRIAADDNPGRIMDLLNGTGRDANLRGACLLSGIRLLDQGSLKLVRRRLFGAVHDPAPILSF